MNPKRLSTLITGIALISIVSVVSCNKEKKIVSTCNHILKDSSFRIEETVGVIEKRSYETDTVLPSGDPITFTAVDTSGDEYFWTFGTDPQTRSGKTVKLPFDFATELDIQLSIKRNTNNPCYSSLGTETVYSRRLVVSNPNRSPIIGKFRGYNISDTNTKFTVEVLLNGLKNLPNHSNGTYNFSNEIDYGATSFWLGGGGTYDPINGAYGTSGFGYLTNGNRKLRIDYKYRKADNPNTYTEDSFIGSKL